MKDRLLLRIIANAISFLMYYTGILPVMLKIFQKKGLYVFNYHCFNTFVNEIWRIGSLYTSRYEKNFEKQILFFNRYFDKLENFDLKRDGYEKPRYLLTFDDGYKDNYDIALPIIKKYSVPAIFFISTSVVGSKRLLWYDKVRFFYEQNGSKGILHSVKWKGQCKSRIQEFKQMDHEDFVKNIAETNMAIETDRRLMMDWTEIREAHESGILIGSHTHTHPVLANLDVDSQKEDIQKSTELIHKHIGFTPYAFAYPEGSRDSFHNETVDILKNIGFKYAFTTLKGINKKKTSPYHLQRIGINPKDPIPLVALKTLSVAVNDSRKNNRLKDVKLSLEQFGWMNLLRRLLKKTGSIFGFRLETYYILHRTLDEEIKLFPLSEEAQVKELTYEDFKDSEFFHLYPQNKKDLYKQRFSNQAYRAYGVSIDGVLVYMTWIAMDFLSVDKIQFEKRLEQDEGVLVDSFALPKSRRHGIHLYMNGYRLKKLKEIGVRKVYAAVLAENIPALKTQIKHGFRQGEKVSWLKFGKLQKYFKKKVHY